MRIVRTVLIAAGLLACTAAPVAAQTIPSTVPARPPVVSAEIACSAPGRATVTVSVRNDGPFDLLLLGAEYVAPIPVPFPAGAGGTPISPVQIPSGWTSVGTDVVIADAGVEYQLEIWWSHTGSSGVTPVSFTSPACPGPTSTSPGSTAAAAATAAPAFTG